LEVHQDAIGSDSDLEAVGATTEGGRRSVVDVTERHVVRIGTVVLWEDDCGCVCSGSCAEGAAGCSIKRNFYVGKGGGLGAGISKANGH
jgi:hypothetical protein